MLFCYAVITGKTNLVFTEKDSKTEEKPTA